MQAERARKNQEMHDSGLNIFGLSVSSAFGAKTSLDNHLLLNLYKYQKTTSTTKTNHLSSGSSAAV